LFSLTLRDHLQLTFNEILERHEAHAAKALRRGQWSRGLRACEAVLIGCASIAATGVAFGRSQTFAIVAAVLAVSALVVLLVQLSFELDASARAHAASSAQLWALRERYRALLSDLHDGILTVAEARVRRDKLLDDLKAVYEMTPVIALVDAEPDAATDAARPASPQPPAIRSA
jgi:hypothetical protein